MDIILHDGFELNREHPSFNNYTAAKVFIIIHLISFVFFIFNNQFYNLLGGNLGPISYEFLTASSYFTYFSIIFVTYFCLLLSGRFMIARDYLINFPFLIHFVLLGVEFLFTSYATAGAISAEHARELYAARTENLGHLKISSLFLYMTTMLLGSKLAQTRFQDFSSIIFLILTLVLFAYKDFAVGSRGAVINAVSFLFAGFTFVRPFEIRKIFGFRNLVFLMGVFFAIIVLSFRRGGGAGLAALTDSLLYKFSINVYIPLVYLSDDVDVRVMNNGTYTTWTSLRDLPNVDESISKLHLFNSLPDFINKYILRFFDYETGSVYFHIFGESPWNSVNYTMRFIVFDLLGIFLLVVSLFIYINLARLSVALRFYVHCSLVYFTITSFTGFSLLEIPFLLVVIFAPLFSLIFVRKYND